MSNSLPMIINAAAGGGSDDELVSKLALRLAQSAWKRGYSAHATGHSLMKPLGVF